MTWQQACRALSPGRVRGMLRSGRWQRYGRGVLIGHNGPVTREQVDWAAVLEAGPGALLGGLTAATHSGLKGYDDGVIQILVPGTRRPVPHRMSPGGRPVRLYRTTAVDPRDAFPEGRPPRTMIARSLVDAAQWTVSDERACAIILAGVQQRLVSLDELRRVLARLPRVRRRAVINEAVADAAGGADSLPERQLRRLCRRHRLPLPDQQVRRRDSTGRERWLDAYWKEWRLHVEVDGGHHTEVSAWWNDMRRQNALWVSGDRVLRFPSWAIRHRAAEVVAQIRAALIAAGWEPAVS